MMNELHDNYTFVNKRNLNLNKNDLNSCVMLGFVLILVCFTHHFPFVWGNCRKGEHLCPAMCFQFHGILSHCKG